MNPYFLRASTDIHVGQVSIGHQQPLIHATFELVVRYTVDQDPRCPKALMGKLWRYFSPELNNNMQSGRLAGY